MLLEPATIQALQDLLADASANRSRISAVKLQAFDRVIEYTPEDMVVTVQTGITLVTLQNALRKYGQWLPIDPPDPTVTIAEIISGNLSGPRRLGFGTIRDHLLGLSALLADGTRISGGGKVVKNVAGFDLPKLFVGAQGSLGIPIEASFKLLPMPELEEFAAATFESVEEAGPVIDRFAENKIWPSNLDIYRLEGLGGVRLLAGFTGAREDVEAHIKKATNFGLAEKGSIEEQNLFWEKDTARQKCSVLPSVLLTTVEQIKPDTFLARAGNGILYHRGGENHLRSTQAPELMKRLKDAYDPYGILPEFAL
ncbi:MAG: linked oxidase domain protein [Verrucomicrobiales bacterium]|nr:linked oxidase domain protein [Verrucomicrobiales bacterium]